MALSLFYRQCGHVLTPSPASDESVARWGSSATASGAGDAASTRALDPVHAARDAFPGEIKVIYAGRLTMEKGVDLLADSFITAHRRDPRLHLLLAGGGPEEGMLRERLGDRATFLGWLHGDELPRAYASAESSSPAQPDRHLRPGSGRGGGQRASGDRGERWRPGLDRDPTATPAASATPDPAMLAAALLQLADAPAWRARLGRHGLAAARARTWATSMRELAAGYDELLCSPRPPPR